MLDFCREMWYNTGMKSDNNLKTRNTEMVTISRAEYEQLQAQGERIAELEQQLENLLEAIRLAQKKRFGASSERLPEEALEQLSFLFNEPELCADEESKAEEETVETVPSYQRRKKNGYTLDHLPENIPVEVIEHHLNEEERACPVCGEQMEEIGTEVRRRVKIIPAQVIIQEDRYYSYACQKCSKEAIETPVVKANAANLFLPGSFATPEAKAANDKGRKFFADMHRKDLHDDAEWMAKQVYLNVGNFLLGVAALGLDAVPIEGFDAAILDAEFGLKEKGYTSLVVVPVGHHSVEDFNATLPKSRLPQNITLTEV